MKKIYPIIIIVFLTACQGAGNNRLGKDFGLFQETPVWELAKAVRAEDVAEIKRIVAERQQKVDYQEPKFGSTLLMLAVLNEKYESCEALLEMGADANS